MLINKQEYVLTLKNPDQSNPPPFSLRSSGTPAPPSAFRLRHFHPLRPDFAPGARNAIYQEVNGADVGSLGWISKSDRRAGLAQRAQRQALYILYLYYNIQNTT